MQSVGYLSSGTLGAQTRICATHYAALSRVAQS
ncbi:hypothetical protein B0G73_103254 [Paraburkholderia sp. BL25I1N1]|nr:hypothetical protein B0G73_103254 [Paraburkholderia sp. BL25I1N1]